MQKYSWGGYRPGSGRRPKGEVSGVSHHTLADVSAGLKNETYTFELFIENAFDKRAELHRFAQCAEAVCGPQTYIVANTPRTIGLRFGQRF